MYQLIIKRIHRPNRKVLETQIINLEDNELKDFMSKMVHRNHIYGNVWEIIVNSSDGESERFKGNYLKDIREKMIERFGHGE